MTERVSELFMRIADLAIALGEHPMSRHNGCWEHDLGAGWWLAINGHKEPVRARSGKGPEVPPFHCYVERNGWPAGMFSPADGVMGAGLESELIVELEKAIASAKPRACPAHGMRIGDAVAGGVICNGLSVNCIAKATGEGT